MAGKQQKGSRAASKPKGERAPGCRAKQRGTDGSSTAPPRTEPTPAELRRDLADLPVRISRQSWQIQFLVDRLRTVSTDVERGVILDWLERAKRERKDLQGELEDRQALYERLMRARRRRSSGARARSRRREPPADAVPSSGD